MQGYVDTFIPLIPLENEPLHTPIHPFCGDMTCLCHEDQDHLSQVAQWVTDGLMSTEEATNFVAGRTLCWKGNTTEQPLSHEVVSILHELDLGQHTLCILSDGGIDLLATDEQTSSLVENEIRLDGNETYRLFISLHEQFL